MFKFARNVALFGSLLLFFSCSRSYNSTTSVVAESETNIASYREPQGQTPEFIYTQDPAIGRFYVPPEIAYLQATLYARGNSFDEVAEFISTNSAFLQEQITQVPGCEIDVLDYNHPRGVSEKRIISGDMVYSGNSVAQITIDFAQSQQLEDRIVQLNKCLKAIPQLKLDNPQKKNTAIGLELSRIVPTVRDTGIYREQLLKSQFARLQGVAQVPDPPSQFSADSTKCTSNGLIEIRERSLSRVELVIDFKCQKFQ